MVDPAPVSPHRDSVPTPVSVGRTPAATAALTELDDRTVSWFRLAGGRHRGAIASDESAVIARAVRLATEMGVPVVGELATSGADVGEGVASLHAWGRLARQLTQASGVVPVVFIVTGPCLSGPSLLLGLADHVVMTNDAFAYVSGPGAVEQFTGLSVDHRTLGGAPFHASRSGLATLVVDDVDTAYDAVAGLLSYLPANTMELAGPRPSSDPPDRPSHRAGEAVPTRATASYDVRAVITDVCDRDSFTELRPAHAPNIVTGYARLGGRPVGVVANQPCRLAGSIDIEASSKAARFVTTCDLFNVPIVTFVDTSGFQPGKELEWRGIIRHGAELVHAYAAATVPRICVILRKAYGGAYIVMDSRGLGNDLCLAWPTAEIAVMGAAPAVQVLGRRALSAISEDDERARRRTELESEYATRHLTPAAALQRGFVDAVVEPEETRVHLVAAVARLAGKRESLPRRKHSNTPL